MNIRVKHAIMDDRVARISRGVEYFQSELPTLGFIGKLPPIDLWHHNVSEQ